VDSGLEQARRSVEEALDRSLPPESSWPVTIHRAMRYSLFGGGKRIRALLALEAGQAVGGELEELLPFACAVELIHTYSLIHDDLPAMDDDDLRRGQPTSHKVFGEAIAILAGDALLTRAFELLATVPEEWDDSRRLRRWQATAWLASACGTRGLIGGQVEDLETEGRPATPESLERIHRAKTGALLRASVRGGAVIGGATPDQLARLTRYGEALGLAFQIVDDVLDTTGSEQQLGKTPGKDRAAGKATYVSLHGIEPARLRARKLLEEALEAVAPFSGWSPGLEALARTIVERTG
jgi:geranylgeranyl diphosphate synthase, type II